MVDTFYYLDEIHGQKYDDNDVVFEVSHGLFVLQYRSGKGVILLEAGCDSLILISL